MLELHEDIELRQLVVRLQPVVERAFVFEAKRRVDGVVKPFIEVRRFQLRVVCIYGFYRTALGMPTHDNIRDFQHPHCVLDRACLGEVAGRRPLCGRRRNQVTDVAHRE